MEPSLSVVASKFATPRLGIRSIPRQHLVASLSEARHCKLVLITGGAGFGKTTLMAQWRQELVKACHEVIWLSLGQDDSSPAQFCAMLHAALHQAGLPVDQGLLLSSASGGSTQEVAQALINALTPLQQECYLLIDDFHHITDAATLLLVQALVDANLPKLHVVLASRTTSSLLLGRLRAMGELAEIHGADLSFDFRETLAFLRSHLDAGVDVDVAKKIHDLTDGWAIGLQLVSISLKTNPRNRAHLRSLAPSSADLAAYLSEDVIAGLPRELFDFMQRVSVLRRFNAEAAAYVTGCEHAADMISAIEAHNLFLLPVDMKDQCRWYRFHPLFEEFLATSLAQGDADVQGLHRRAAAWFAQHDMLVEAMHHALKSDTFKAVVQLMERSSLPLSGISQLSAFLHWVDRVPSSLLAQHPRMLMVAGWACAMTGRTAQAEAWVAALETARTGPNASPHIALLKAMLAVRRDDTVLAHDILCSISEISFGHPVPENLRAALLIRCLAAQGQYAQARSVYNGSAARSPQATASEAALMVAVSMGMTLWLEGKVLEMERLGAVGLEQAVTLHGSRSVSACMCAAVLATALYELDRVAEAREALANRLDMLRLSSPDLILHTALCHARLLQSEGMPREAAEYLAQEAAYLRGLGFARGAVYVMAEEQRFALMGGDWRHAESLQTTLEGLARSSPHDADITAMVVLSRARVALARHDPQKALQALAAVRAMAIQYGRGALQVKADLLEAQALEDLGRDAEAPEYLQMALAAGYRLGLRRTLLDEGVRALAMLQGQAGHCGEVLAPYLALLLGRAVPDASQHAGRDADAAVALPARVAALDFSGLTPRENDIMALLEQSMPNKRIALTLNISVQTVKWNLRRIFSKLGVSSRYEAIIVARRQGLSSRQD